MKVRNAPQRLAEGAALIENDPFTKLPHREVEQVYRTTSEPVWASSDLIHPA